MSPSLSVESFPSAYTLACDFLSAIQTRDWNGIRPLLDDDFILEVPFNVSGTNDYSDIMHRIEQIKRQFKETWKFLVDIKYDEIDITSGNNTNNAFAETLGNMKLSTDGRYRNRYIFRFDAREGLLVRIREYTNPITSIKAWGERHSG